MIKINWTEVSNLKTLLQRQGATSGFELVVMILYHAKLESDRIRVQLEDLEGLLFSIESDRRVRGVFLYDVEIKKPFLRFREPELVSPLESIPNSGHPDVVLEFGKMSPEARDVWMEITYVQLLQHLQTTGVT
jgi:hypothetical protein